MLKNIWIWIMTNIFRIQTETIPSEIDDNQKYATEYEQINNINFNAIFSNKLANYVINDSTLNIDGKNDRADLLNKIGQSMWKRGKKIIGMSFGFGGMILVPYVKGGKLYYNLVPQNRVSIDETDGDLITGATILADRKEIASAFNMTKVYLRWTNYRIKNGNITITQKFTTEEGKEVEAPEFWKNIPTKMTITGVDRALFGYIKSPINNRKSNDKYGVPITYGCDEIIKEIRECLQQIQTEFKVKEAFIGVDYTLFKQDKNKNPILPKEHLYQTFNSDGDNFWEVFSPDIRESSYYVRLQELYQRLEHAIGTSGGILSEVQTNNATATEIKRSTYDTWTIVDDMRSNIEKGLEDFFYACNVLANAYNLSSQGDYELSFDWSYSLLEDTQQEFSQLVQGINLGVIDKVELRQWLNPDEDIKESEKKVQEISENNPSVEDLVGRDEQIPMNRNKDKKDDKKQEENKKEVKEDKKEDSKK